MCLRRDLRSRVGRYTLLIELLEGDVDIAERGGEDLSFRLLSSSSKGSGVYLEDLSILRTALRRRRRRRYRRNF